jgi:hypothetical protein
VLGAVHDARAAVADRLDDPVAADEGVDPPVHRVDFYNHGATIARAGSGSVQAR